MTPPPARLLQRLSTLLNPLFDQFEAWVRGVNRSLSGVRDSMQTEAFPASVHVSFLADAVSVEALVVAVAIGRQGSHWMGKGDLTTGDGRVLAETPKLRVREDRWEADLVLLVEHVGDMLESAQRSPEVVRALTRESDG